MSEITQIQKLQALKEQSNSKKKQSTMTSFDTIGIFVGAAAKEHFPKLLDSNGNKIQEESNGRKYDKRSEISDGWTYTFTEFETSKMIQIVFPKKFEFKLLGAYKLQGLGYDIKQANMIFIEKDTQISNL